MDRFPSYIIQRRSWTGTSDACLPVRNGCLLIKPAHLLIRHNDSFHMDRTWLARKGSLLEHLCSVFQSGEATVDSTSRITQNLPNYIHTSTTQFSRYSKNPKVYLQFEYPVSNSNSNFHTMPSSIPTVSVHSKENLNNKYNTICSNFKTLIPRTCDLFA